MSNKHMPYDLVQMQSLPLRAKIIMTQQRIRQWYEYWDGNVYVSFSGGKDSSVLKHIVDDMYTDVPALYVNTGLEYPEIQKFVREVKAGKYGCFNSDVEIIRPEMRFDEVINKYGYPVISKEIAKKIYECRITEGNGKESYARKQFEGTYVSKNGKSNAYSIQKWKFMLDAPFGISHMCCDVMKKKPSKKYEKETGRKAFIGTQASESKLRKSTWMKFGCNAFEKGRPSSQPLSFWTKQDILQYIKEFNVPYCPIYGDIIEEETQLNIFNEETPKLCTSGANRTGCIFCMFGCHLEKEPNRFQKLKETHPRQYDYCINGGEYDESGKWTPNKEGLGLGKILEYIGVDYE